MSTEVTLFKNGIPDYLREAGLDETTKSLLSGGGNGGKRISIRGGVFRMVVDGKEVAANEDRAMNMVIVNAAPKTSRAYYANTYDPNVTNVSPTCWSPDGDRPDKSIAKPQCATCAQCPQNIRGSGQGDSRACRYSRRLAVVLENDLGGDIFQLTLPATSLFGKGENGKLPLNAYAQFLAGFNVNVTAVVTEMRFDVNSATPKLTFKAVRPLTEAEYRTCVDKGQSPEAKAAVTVSYSGSAPAQAAPALKQLFDKKEAPETSEPEASEPAPEEPKKRESKKQQEEAPKKNLKDILDQWDDE
jgi:hypothetical protein